MGSPLSAPIVDSIAFFGHLSVSRLSRRGGVHVAAKPFVASLIRGCYSIQLFMRYLPAPAPIVALPVFRFVLVLICIPPLLANISRPHLQLPRVTGRTCLDVRFCFHLVSPTMDGLSARLSHASSPSCSYSLSWNVRVQVDFVSSHRALTLI
jgi:hypothetical protein